MLIDHLLVSNGLPQTIDPDVIGLTVSATAVECSVRWRATGGSN